MVHENVSFKNAQSQIRPRILSPPRDPAAPDALRFYGPERFWRLFYRRNSCNSRLSRRKSWSIQDFFERIAEVKLRSDADMGYDISVTPYPLGFDPTGWGILTDRVGRIFGATVSTEDSVELQYQSGRCRTIRDWRELVESRSFDEHDRVRSFYNRIRVVADKRISVAGTAGFGFWDALWMAFDFDSALEMLSKEPDFANMVFRHWKSFHIGVVSAMLDAGIKMIFFREHSRGFSQLRGLSARLDGFLKGHYSDISHLVHSRGGSLFLDCDADEMIETEYPAEWGFDGIGPLLFRDMDDLVSARRSLNQNLLLVGATLLPVWPGTLEKKELLGQNLILAVTNSSVPSLESKERGLHRSNISGFLRNFDFASWIRTGAWHS
ncbi:MAG: hypothetical protein HY912_03130 [Desulfomonile tiedjei]|uniref:Uroporphyrinogen decarboxylase (URO-D) domain-containing protein n=1 Tax=Desulfomonile tiedjei TaxID=2358 RepID=A0A9D6UXY7_9BACT|nr:hypothetical protein [Desulfomonile tiedjei]